MEAVALKIAGDVAAPVGTHIYDALKKQTGRAKFEQGKSTMQDGFAILRDEKAGGLLSPQERLELLQTHRKLVADREDVDEVTNTFYGSLAHRNTAKEFSSKAQKFRKDVETPAEKAQMQYELRKAEREMVAPRRKPLVAQLDTSGANTIRVKNSGELTRKPTLLDYPSDAQRAPTVSPQSQRTRSLPEPKTPSAYPTPAADSVGEFKPALRRQKHILNASADTYPNRRIPPHSRVEGQQYASAQPSDAQRFQPAVPHPPPSYNPPLRVAVPPEPPEFQHRLQHSRSGIALNGAYPNRPRPQPLQSLASVSEQEARYGSAPQMTQSRGPMGAADLRSGTAQNQGKLNHHPIQQHAQTSETYPRSYEYPTFNGGTPALNPHVTPPNLTRGDLTTPPMYWNIHPEPMPPNHGDPGNPCQCSCQNPYLPAYQGPCANCRSTYAVAPPFPHPMPNQSYMPYNSNNNWSRNERGVPGPAAIQIEVRVQYPPGTDYSGRTTSYR